jgi:hypothetical protein
MRFEQRRNSLGDVTALRTNIGNGGAFPKGRCIDLVVMGTIREGTEFINERLIPGAIHQFDKTVLALRCKRIGAVLLVAGLGLGADGIALQLTDEVTRLEFSGAAGVLRYPDLLWTES